MYWLLDDGHQGLPWEPRPLAQRSPPTPSVRLWTEFFDLPLRVTVLDRLSFSAEEFGSMSVPDDLGLTDAECFLERAKQARALADKRREGSTKQLLIALAENFERLAELTTKEGEPQ
jgi:hypothetical protein